MFLVWVVSDPHHRFLEFGARDLLLNEFLYFGARQLLIDEFLHLRHYDKTTGIAIHDVLTRLVCRFFFFASLLAFASCLFFGV